MASQSDSDDRSKIENDTPYRATILPTTKVEFDTMQSIDLAGFRAPPTSPCTTFLPSNLLTQLQIQNTCELPNINSNELEMQSELFKRKRGRKSVPHVATLFEPFKQADLQQFHENQEQKEDHSSSSSASASVSSMKGNEPPPNSPESGKVCSMNALQRCEQQQSILANLSNNTNTRQDDEDFTRSAIPYECCLSTTERANQLFQLKTQLHLTHKLQQLCQIEDSNKKME